MSLRGLHTSYVAAASEHGDSPEELASCALSALLSGTGLCRVRKAGRFPFAVPLLRAQALTVSGERRESLGSTRLSGLLGTA